MRRLALLALVVVTLAHVPLAVVAVAVLASMKSFLSIVLAPALLASLVLMVVTFWSLRANGDGPRPAFGVAFLAAVQGLVLAVGTLQNKVVDGLSLFDVVAVTREQALAVAAALVLDAGLIALCTVVLEADHNNAPISPLVKKRLLFGALALALLIAVLVKQGASALP